MACQLDGTLVVAPDNDWPVLALLEVREYTAYPDCLFCGLAGRDIFRLRGGRGHAALAAAAPCYRSSVEEEYTSSRRLSGVVAARVVGIGISSWSFLRRSSVAYAVTRGPVNVGDNVADRLDV